MKNYNRFESQYILMLASRAKRDLLKDPGAEPIWIHALQEIIDKSKYNMKEIDLLEDLEKAEVNKNEK